MSSSLTTVVITYHNEGPLLARAVRSIDAQTGSPNIEIIVVDDASELAPPVVASRWPLRVIRSERPLHVSGARNLGIRHAQGDLVSFLDADDEYAPDRIQPHAAFLEDHPDAWMVGGQTFVTHAGVPALRNPPVVERFFPEYARSGGILPDSVRFRVCDVDLLFEKGLIVLFGTGAMTVRRGRLLELGGFDDRLFFAEEWDLQVRIAQRGKIGFVPIPAYYYYVGRTGSITTTKNPDIYLCAAAAYRSWRRTVPNLPRHYRRMLGSRAHAANLVAAQLWLEQRGDSVKALRAVMRSFASGWSVWAMRSLLRATLYSCVPDLIGRVPPLPRPIPR